MSSGCQKKNSGKTEMAARKQRCAHLDPAAGLNVLTNMQWMYGATWGSTLRRCDQLSKRERGDGCAQEDEVRARQLELVEVLRRNVVNPAVAEVHVLVGEAEPVRGYCGASETPRNSVPLGASATSTGVQAARHAAETL